MAYGADGTWKPEDDSVASRITGLIQPDNPFVMQAKTDANNTAQRRGMLNSSLAIGEGEKAAFNAALPIASQDAATTANKNLSAQGAAQQTGLQTQQIQGQKDLQSTQIAADASTQANALSNNLSIANLDATTRTKLGQLDADTQTSIANMNVAANQRDKATAAAISAGANYSSMFNAIASNANIPAATRDLYLGNAKAQQDSTMSLIQGLYGVDLSWTNPATGQPTSSPGTSPTAAMTPPSSVSTPPATPGAQTGTGAGYSGRMAYFASRGLLP